VSLSLKYQQLKSITRAGDWRFSFIPHLFGNLYLWMLILEIDAKKESALLLTMSLFTSFGFAALGYFINEYFDQEQDEKAGKLNKMRFLKLYQKLLLLIAILLLTFLPWTIIPWNSVSVILIFSQIFLFLLYSIPFTRFKEKPLISGLIDASYAYIIPMLLSFYSFFLFAKKDEIPQFIFFYSFLLFAVGFRNITIHQINDIFKDKKVGIKSFPMILGVVKTNSLLKTLILLEFTAIVFLSIYLIQINFLFLSLFLVLIFYAFQVFSFYKQTNDKIIVNRPIRHLTDTFYQIWFPLITLITLISIDLKWIIVLPIHLFLLVDLKDTKFFYSLIISYMIRYFYFFLNSFWHLGLKVVISFITNNIIYFSFKIFGVDLKKEKISALAYLKSKWGM
jgi:4-hydroxybenzoate polyprenyltransferase